MSRRALFWGLLGLVALTLASSAPAAIAAPVFDIKTSWSDTKLPPGGTGLFDLWVRNIGDATEEEALLVKNELPAGVIATDLHFVPRFGVVTDDADLYCTGEGSGTVECLFPGPVVAELVQAPGPFAGQVASPTGYMTGSIGIEVAIDPGASGTATNTATVSGGGAIQPDADTDLIVFDQTPSGFGIVPGSFEADLFDAPLPFGEPSRQAADHPFELRVNFDLNQHTGKSTLTTPGGPIELPKSFPNGSLATVESTLPRGMIGNPEAIAKCDPVKFAEKGATDNSTACPANTQVGYLNASTASFALRRQGLTRVPIYNLEPPKGEVADFGFNAGGFVQGHIYPTPDPAQSYAIKALTANISNLVPATGAEVVIWGVPGDPAHDKFRYYPKVQPGEIALGAPFGDEAIRPLLTNPSDCGFDNGGSRIRIESYTNPGVFTPVEEYGQPHNVTGCEDPRFRFEPEVALKPTSTAAGGPTGLDVHLAVPQRDDRVADAKELYAQNSDVQGISTPPIKKAVVTLPEGMTVSPSAAQGLGTCTPSQIGLNTDRPVTCPDNSQYGTLTLHTPILPIDEQPEGFIYVARQNDNPFGTLLALYMVIEEPDRGILVKIPGRVDLNSETGQIVTTFDDLPQFPVDDFQMTFKGGVRAALVNPSTCGTKTIRAEFFSWHDPQTPRVVNNSYNIARTGDGDPCVHSLGERQFRPQLEAGTANNTAGSYSPFLMRLTRTDDDQEFSQVGVTLPQGLLAKLAGVSMCSDASIAQAIARTGAGEGALEQSNPSCPDSSLIGVTEVGVGVGVPLTYVPGRVYLSGPYAGAPLSLVAISPAVVGPYDLGVIGVRSALRVDPVTAQASALTDPLPQIFHGIPVRIRDIRIQLNRDQFTLNPTDCSQKQIGGRITGTGGNLLSTADDTSSEMASRFQAADCASLGFKPKLSFRLLGGTRRGAHPKLRAVVKLPPRGGANVASASVALPGSEFLDQAHIKTVCTRVQFAAEQCPPGSIYGHAVAKTPLFDQPLKGPVHLRSSSNTLPDLVVVLKGPASQPIEVDLVGRIDSVNGGIRTTFSSVPDAPVHSFTLTMQGGKKGLLVNSTNLCSGRHRATAKFTGQNGRKLTLRPEMRTSCRKTRPKRQKKH